MSTEASGTIGKSLTFANWVGRQYVRRWTRPSNPQTADQMDQRNAFSVIGVGVSWANNNLQVNNNTGKTDERAFRDKTPSGMRWNGYIQKVLTGTGAAGYSAAKAAWNALPGQDRLGRCCGRRDALLSRRRSTWRAARAPRPRPPAKSCSS